MSRFFGAAAFLIPLVVYWWTAAPGMTLIDGGGWPSAPGGRGWPIPRDFRSTCLWDTSLLIFPWPSRARNLNLFSALCGAAACWLVFMSARLVVRHGRDWTADLAALSAALTFGFTFVLWGFTSFTEV